MDFVAERKEDFISLFLVGNNSRLAAFVVLTSIVEISHDPGTSQSY